jgi:putative endonuclease
VNKPTSCFSLTKLPINQEEINSVSTLAKENQKWIVYFMRCRDGSLYCGITNDLEKRTKDHNAGKGSAFVKSRLPVECVYVELAEDKSSALKREYALKLLPRPAKVRLVQDFSKIK